MEKTIIYTDLDSQVLRQKVHLEHVDNGGDYGDYPQNCPPYLFCFFCVDMTFNWFQMLFRVFCIVSVQDLYALEKFQSTRQQQQLRETQAEIDLDTSVDL